MNITISMSKAEYTSLMKKADDAYGLGFEAGQKEGLRISEEIRQHRDQLLKVVEILERRAIT